MEDVQPHHSAQHNADQGNLKQKRARDEDVGTSSKRSNLQTKIYAVSTSNRFELLSSHEESDNHGASETVIIPPIYVYHIDNHPEFVRKIKETVTGKFSTELKENKIKVNLETVQDFRTLTTTLEASNIQFHTYADPLSKKTSLVIKNLHVSISEDEIKSELIEKYPTLVRVTRLHGKDRKPIPVVAVEFSSLENINQILKEKYLCNSVVKFETRRKHKGPIQCSRCQDFGHSKGNCRKNFTCAICAANHLTADCKAQSSIPLCVNCKSANKPHNHRADTRSSACDYYNRICSTRKDKNPPRMNQSPQPTPTLSSQTHFPLLPQTNVIPHFNQAPQIPVHQTYAQPHNPYPNIENHHTGSTDSSNSTNFINGILTKITNYFQKVIELYIPMLIEKLKDSITASLNASFAP